MLLHWLIAAAIIGNYVLVNVAEESSEAMEEMLVGYHKALGITILLLTVLRIIWRITHKPPPLAVTLKPWERALARISHAGFYVLMIGIPLTGWMMTSAFSGGAPVDMFGLFQMPGLPLAQSRDTAGVLHEVHETGAKIMFVLFILHVAGAFKHLLIDKDGTMQRMLPGR